LLTSHSVHVAAHVVQRGNLQDLITRSSATSPPSRPPERQLLDLFLGTAEGVRAMHRWKPSAQGSGSDDAASASYPPNASAVFNADEEGLGDHDDGEGGALLLQNAASAGQTEGPGEDAIDESGKGKGKQREANHPAADESGTVPWAHRDIKPA
jgi:serine/threonine kinase 16